MDNNTLSKQNDYIDQKIKEINPILNKHLDFFSYYINKNKNFFIKEKELSEKIALTLLKNKSYDNAFYFLSKIKSCYLKMEKYHPTIDNFKYSNFRHSRSFQAIMFGYESGRNPEKYLYQDFYNPDLFAVAYDDIKFLKYCLESKKYNRHYLSLFLFVKIEHIFSFLYSNDYENKHLKTYFPNFEHYFKLMDKNNFFTPIFSYSDNLSLNSYDLIFKYLKNSKSLIIKTLKDHSINSPKFQLCFKQDEFHNLSKEEKIEILDEKIEQFPFYQDRESFKNAIEDYRIFYKSFDITMNENNHIQFKLLSTTLNQVQELGNEEIIQRLSCFKDLDFNINVLDQNNETILFKFVEKYINEDKILLLYSLQSLGFDLTIRNKDNLSILDYLEEHNYSFLKNTLLQIKVKMEQFELNQEFNKPIKKQHRL